MIPLLRTIAAPILSLIILITGSGLFTTFISIRLQMEGYSQEMVGYVTAAFFAGLTLGSLRVHHLIQRIGHIRAFANFASAMAVLALLQAIFLNPWIWVLLRFLSGIFIAGLFISIESWLIIQSTPEKRGRVLSIYMIAFYGALSMGQFMLKWTDPKGIMAFLIMALLCSFSVLPISMTKFDEPIIEEHSSLNVLRLFRIAPLGIIASLISGLFLGAIYGLLPYFCKEINFTTSQVGTLMGLTILGSLVLQWPIGKFSDFFDRRKIIFGVGVATAILSTIFFFFATQYNILLLLTATIFGGFSFTIYPLSISHASDAVDKKDAVAALGGLNVAYGLGAVFGPILAAFMMQAFGPYGLFIYFIAISCILSLYALWRIKIATPIPQSEKQPFRNIPRTTSLVVELDPRVDGEISMISRPH